MACLNLNDVKQSKKEIFSTRSFGQGITEKLNKLTEKSIGRPYCGETIAILVDSADLEQQYIEDC